MNRRALVSLLAGFLFGSAALSILNVDNKNLRRENAGLVKKLDQIEIGFVIDNRDVTWVKVKNGKHVNAISCTGDSVSFMISNTDVDTVFTKITIEDLMMYRRLALDKYELKVYLELRGDDLWAVGYNGVSVVKVHRPLKDFGLQHMEQAK